MPLIIKSTLMNVSLPKPPFTLDQATTFPPVRCTCPAIRLAQENENSEAHLWVWKEGESKLTSDSNEWRDKYEWRGRDNGCSILLLNSPFPYWVSSSPPPPKPSAANFPLISLSPGPRHFFPKGPVIPCLVGRLWTQGCRCGEKNTTGSSKSLLQYILGLQLKEVSIYYGTNINQYHLHINKTVWFTYVECVGRISRSACPPLVPFPAGTFLSIHCFLEGQADGEVEQPIKCTFTKVKNKMKNLLSRLIRGTFDN